MQTQPSIVFVHGLWADGSCFSKVIPPLQAEGCEVMASQHSLDSVKGDVPTVKRTPGRVSGPGILVGHSYGGTLITAAGTDDPELQRFVANRRSAATTELDSSHARFCPTRVGAVGCWHQSSGSHSKGEAWAAEPR